MKSFIKVLLAAAAFFVSPSASAYGIFEADGFYYYITSEADKTVEVTSGENSYVGDVSIPATVEYGGDTYTVTKIGGFSYCSGLTSVDIPDGVVSIGNSAFLGCSSLASIDIPNGVVSIGGYAFTECSSLTSVDIPDGVTSLGDGAFSYCSGLESVTLGSRVETIGEYAFYGCDNLAVIDCRAVLPPVCLTATCFGDISNCTLSVPEGTEEAYKTADVWKEFFYEYFMRGGIKYGAQTSPQGNIAMVVAGGEYTGDITIPATVENGGITYTVTSIRANAFAECSDLVSVDIPAGVTSIGEAAFNYCSSLTYVDIPNGVTSIGYGAFSDCSSLVSVDIPDGVKSIGGDAFSYCSSLESVTLGSGVETIGDYAFEYCENLESINIPYGVTSIGYSAFSRCSVLAGITLPESLAEIGEYAFSRCENLESINIPDKVNSIADYTFYYCSSLASVDIPDGVTSIGDYAFSYCSGLTSVDIPDGVVSIGNSAFLGCSSLAEINSLATLPPACEISCFFGVDKNACTLNVPEGTADDYRAADVWKEFFNIVETDFAGIGEIAADAYRRRCTGIRRYGLRRPNRDSRAGRETLYCKVRQCGVQNGDVAGGT